MTGDGGRGSHCLQRGLKGLLGRMGGIVEWPVGYDLTLTDDTDHVCPCLEFYSRNTHSFSEEGEEEMGQALSHIPH